MQAKNYALLVMQPQLVFPPSTLLPRPQCLQKYHHFVLNSTEAFPLASFRALPRILHGSAASHLQLTRQIQIQHSQKTSQISPLTRYCRQLSSRYVSVGLYNTRNFTEFTYIFTVISTLSEKMLCFLPRCKYFCVLCATRAVLRFPFAAALKLLHTFWQQERYGQLKRKQCRYERKVALGKRQEMAPSAIFIQAKLLKYAIKGCSYRITAAHNSSSNSRSTTKWP